MLVYLKEKGYIKNEMVSFYIDLTGKSHMKFGDFDYEAVNQTAEFAALPSTSQNTWDFDLTSVSLAGWNRFHVKAAFNPAFPHIYVPDEDWASLVKKFNEEFKGKGIECTQTDKGECKLMKSCAEVKHIIR